MNKQSENGDKLLTPHNIIVLLLVLCSYIFLYWGHTFSERNWGLDQITYLSSSQYIFWIIISVISVLLLLVGIKKHFISDLLYDFLWGGKKLYGRWLVVILGMAIFFYFRFEAFLYGDGYIRIGNFAQKGQPLFHWYEFGSTYIPYIFYQIIILFGVTKLAASILAYQLVSVLSGGFFLLFSIKISDLLYDNYHDKITSLFLLMLSGISMMFFGLVENFPILLAAGILFIYLLALTINSSNKKYLYYLLALTLIGVMINFQFITFVPLLIYVIIKSFIKREKTGKLLGLIIAFGLIPLAVVILYVKAANDMWLENLILLLNGKSPEAHYWLFSQIHLLDIFNLIFVFVPIFLLFIFAIIVGFIKLKKDKLFIILSLLVFVQIIYLLIIDPKNGMIRDIPQYSFLLLGFVFWGIYAVIKIRKQAGLSQSIVMGLCPVAFVLMLPGLMVHLSPSKTEESINKYLKYNESKYQSGLLAFRDYYFAAGDMDKSNYYDQLVEKKSPGALQSRLVNDLYAHGRYTESFNYANQLVERYPYNYQYRIHRSNLLKYYKRFGEAKSELDTAIILAPYIAETYHFLAEYFREQKIDSKCFEILQKAVSFAPDNPIILIDLTAYYFRSSQFDRADSLAKTVMAIDSMAPYAYMYQGLIADNFKRYDKAMEFYSKFIELNDKLPEVSYIRKRQNDIYLLRQENNR